MYHSWMQHGLLSTSPTGVYNDYGYIDVQTRKIEGF